MTWRRSTRNGSISINHDRMEKLKIDFKRLTEIKHSEIIGLMNNPLVRRHLPLTRDDFGESECDAFVVAKERLWSEHGYGPWAFVIKGQFVGWGGLQPENGEADLGLVLDPNFWGIGKALCEEIIGRAFREMGFESVTVLLPATRIRIKGLLRLGFEEDGELTVGDERFSRYRLAKYVKASDAADLTGKPTTVAYPRAASSYAFSSNH